MVKNKTLVFILTTFLMVISFVLYQYFFQGFTNLKNPAKVSNVVISDVSVKNGEVIFQGYNMGGETGYLVQIDITDGTNNVQMNATELGQFPIEKIENKNINKVKGNQYALVFSRGSKAILHIPVPEGFDQSKLNIKLTDVSGKVFEFPKKQK